MTETPKARVTEWVAPERPDWVAKVNQEGQYLDIRGIVPLDAESLIATAIRNTGLSDFGADDWREPFNVFVKSVDEEGELTLMGRILTRSDILMHLEARLGVEDMFKRHPEIEDEVIRNPVMILGSGRSGTSLIQNLMMNDPDNATPRTWEAMFPVPPPTAETYHSDPRIEKAHMRISMWDRVSPLMGSVHEWEGDLPTEFGHLENMAFQNSGWLDLLGYCPTFHSFMAGRSMAPSLHYAKRALKLLQWKNPNKRWILKHPDTQRYLPDLMEVFPDLKIVWMHRDPLKSISSGISMAGAILGLRSDRPLGADFISKVSDPAHLAALFDLTVQYMEDGTIDPDHVYHVQYLDLIRDPIATVSKLYEEMDFPFTDEARDAMANYMTENRKKQRAKHVYDVGTEAQQASERALFEPYMQRFNVESEA